MAVLRADLHQGRRGSHLGPTYAGTAFDYHDETTPYTPLDVYERIPDIEADRASHDIVSYAVARGDVIPFHPGLLHGGGATANGRPRRTLSVRFFGDDIVYQRQPRPAPTYPGTSALVEPGQPRRGPWFPKVYPRTAG